jgi:hypothetical protein
MAVAKRVYLLIPGKASASHKMLPHTFTICSSSDPTATQVHTTTSSPCAEKFAISQHNLVSLYHYVMESKGSSPSRGEKPPLRINSRSHSWRSVRTIAGRLSASTDSSFLRGASRAMRSLRTPPANCQSMLHMLSGGKPYHVVCLPSYSLGKI